MALKDSLLPEFDHEMGSTRRILERVPEGDFAWKPHDKSYSLGQLSTHVANLPTWLNVTFDYSEFDATKLPEEARPKVPPSRAELLKRFDENVKAGRAKLDAQSDAAMYAPWTFKNDGHAVFTMPRVAVVRSFVMNHMIHHRGQLTVYLRLRNVPLPPIYGPTADEP
jgi:uncharacterized damage-inducible protein DinB